MKVLVVGPYGGLNLGDDLILESVIGELQADGHLVTVTSARPEYTSERLGVAAIQALDPRHLKFGALRAVAEADVVVFGGGQQIHESRFGNPFWGMLTTCALFIREATRQHKPTYFWGVGVEPMRTPIGPWIARRWISRVSAGTARDQPSLERLLQYGVSPDRLRLSADPVFGLQREPVDQAREFLSGLAKESVTGPTLLLTPAHTRIHDTEHLTALIEGCKQLAVDRGGRVLVHITDRQKRYDLTLLDHPSLAEDQVLQWLPLHPYSAQELTWMYGGADIVVSARMHPLIVTLTQGARWLAVPINEKLRTLVGRFPSSPELSFPLSADGVAQAVGSWLDTPLEQWSGEADPVLAELRSEAQVSRTMFADLVSRHS